jgi:hypothetical protein
MRVISDASSYAFGVRLLTLPASPLINPEFEARNPKQIQNPKREMFKTAVRPSRDSSVF